MLSGVQSRTLRSAVSAENRPATGGVNFLLWQRSANKRWLEENKSRLEKLAGLNLATIALAGRARILIQVTCQRRSLANQLLRTFGGKTQSLPNDWRKSFAANTSTHPSIRIGRRLRIVNAPT